jgi:hypothetical protein
MQPIARLLRLRSEKSSGFPSLSRPFTVPLFLQRWS